MMDDSPPTLDIVAGYVGAFARMRLDVREWMLDNVASGCRMTLSWGRRGHVEVRSTPFQFW